MSSKRAIWFAVLALIAIALMYGVAWAIGRCTRGEFSADTLQCRYREVWLLPLTDIPLYRSSCEYSQNEMTLYLVDRGYWSPRDVPEPHWIDIYRYDGLWRSMLQHNVFRDPERWIEWTERNPRVAAVIWPHVLTVLRDEKYGDEAYAVSLLLFAYTVHDLREFERGMADANDWPKDLPYLPDDWRKSLEAEEGVE
jgi:hypothetical protein